MLFASQKLFIAVDLVKTDFLAPDFTFRQYYYICLEFN